MYRNPRSKTEFMVAQKHLNKVHRQYGTVDVLTIQYLIN